MITNASLAEAMAALATAVDDVRRTAQRYLMARHGRRAATTSLREPHAAYPLGPTPAGALALVGAWLEVEDAAIDQFAHDVARSRSEGTHPEQEHRQ